MIGTNNLGGNSDEQIVEGIKAIVAELHKQTPDTKLLLLGVFPRGMKHDDKNRARIKHINSMIAELDDGGKTIKYLDIGDKFLEADGTLPKSIMPDALHPNGKGYEIWAAAIMPTVQEMMK
jgi:lysophospholipase L1-like esterase